jgi:hypothetical protein
MFHGRRHPSTRRISLACTRKQTRRFRPSLACARNAFKAILFDSFNLNCTPRPARFSGVNRPLGFTNIHWTSQLTAERVVVSRRFCSFRRRRACLHWRHCEKPLDLRSNTTVAKARLLHTGRERSAFRVALDLPVLRYHRPKDCASGLCSRSDTFPRYIGRLLAAYSIRDVARFCATVSAELGSMRQQLQELRVSTGDTKLKKTVLSARRRTAADSRIASHELTPSA